MSSDILNEIIDRKKAGLAAAMKQIPLEVVMEKAKSRSAGRGFAEAVRRCPGPAIIAELKKASPTKGLLCPDFDVRRIAAAYAENGAVAISVLTEKDYFQGDLSYIEEAKSASGLHALRKDFIFDPYQVYEAAAAGADALLLIAAAIDRSRLEDLMLLAHEVGLDVLVEVHNEKELESVSGLPCDLLGVNNRDLVTGRVDIETSIKLSHLIPCEYCKISESGIKSNSDIRKLADSGYRGFLIGETLVKSGDPGAELRKLLEAEG